MGDTVYRIYVGAIYHISVNGWIGTNPTAFHDVQVIVYEIILICI